jgi:hypothetical protein
MKGALLLALLFEVGRAVRVYATLPSPRTHALYERHLTKPPELALFSPRADVFVPGFGCCRAFNMLAPETDWKQTLDLNCNNSSGGGFGPQGLANVVWPGADSALHGNWPVLAALFESRGLPAVDLGGFVPGGLQEYDSSAATNYTEGVAILGQRFVGFDMGEQDVRYLWGYSDRTSTFAGPTSRFERLVSFRDFSDAIEERLARTLAALASSNYAVHHWLKTGFYTSAGAETSQSNGNAQVLYAFVRGAAKQYGSLWFGQVSIYNSFGFKVPGDENPSPACVDQSSHSATCGTSYSLMKRLMYSQLAYNSAYFAFEGGLQYSMNQSALTPIGAMQLAARAFFAAAAAPPAPTLGVHAPTIAFVLDHVGGFVRPCDSRPQKYSAGAWGAVPWDAADALADAVIETVFPGYRAGALLHNETGYLSPTPFGDAIDVLLSDALPSVLALYDTVVLAHRAETDAADLARRLGNFIAQGGTVISTASTLADLGGLAGVTIGACAAAPAGTRVELADGGTDIVETRPLVLCAAAVAGPAGSYDVLATAGGAPVAVRARVGNGTLVAILAGAYGMSTARDAGAPPLYSCGVDEPDTRAAQPAALADFVRHFLTTSLAAAALFDLGSEVAWVPQREAAGRYVLTITNPTLAEAPLTIASRVGPIAWVQVLPLDTSEKGAVGYLPDGFANASIGRTTNTTLAGADTLVVRVVLSRDASTEISPAAPPARATALTARRLLRLSPGVGDLRRAVLARPHMDQFFGGFLIDWAYVHGRSSAALAAEGAWLRARNVTIAVDFSRSTNLFPGLRLSDDLGGAYNESMAAFADVISKMPALGAADALVTLHGGAELAPPNCSTNAQYGAAETATLRMLAAAGAPLGVRLSLRRSFRNDAVAGAGLGPQAAFAAAAGVGFAPSLAFADGAMGGDSAADAAALLTSGAARVLCASAAWAGGSRSLEGAPVAPAIAANGATAAWLRTVHAAAEAAGAAVVVDGAFDETADGRAAALADARALEDVAGL